MQQMCERARKHASKFSDESFLQTYTDIIKPFLFSLLPRQKQLTGWDFVGGAPEAVVRKQKQNELKNQQKKQR